MVKLGLPLIQIISPFFSFVTHCDILHYELIFRT